MAFLPFLKTGFTACLSKTLKITPLLSFFTHPHLNPLGRSEGLVAALEVQRKGFGRKRPWTGRAVPIHARAEAQGRVCDISGPCTVTLGHSSDAVISPAREVTGTGALDCRHRAEIMCIVHMHDYSVQHFAPAVPSNIQKANQNLFLYESCMDSFEILLCHL